MVNFQLANSLFRAAKYKEALDLYIELGGVFGRKNVAYNILMCERKILETSCSSFSGTDGGNEIVGQYFDKIYLVNLRSYAERRISSVFHLSRNGIAAEVIEAVNGYVGNTYKKYCEYEKKPLGSMVRYSSYNDNEIKRGGKYISSPGAYGYLATYINIISNAAKKGYRRILILEDDIMLVNEFAAKFQRFMGLISKDWKIIQLGASQYNWLGIDEGVADRNGYYHPVPIDTCGSFAIGIDCSVYDEMLTAASSYEAPFDHLPMGELYSKYNDLCYVAYPNIVVPDVSDSSIRNSRCQITHSEKMKWPLREVTFPRKRIVLSVLLTSVGNLKYFDLFSKSEDLPFDLLMYAFSNDGPRPVHSKADLSQDYYFDGDVISGMFLSSDYYVVLDPEYSLTERDLLGFIEYKLGLKDKNLLPCVDIYPNIQKIVSNRVSVVIPTFGRQEHLYRALCSVAVQYYEDKEIIVVCDNGDGSPARGGTQEIVRRFSREFPALSIKLIQHCDNLGGAAARNTGILNSSGEYICFLDDDDIYLEGRLDKSIEALKGCPLNVGAVYCAFTGWNSFGLDANRFAKGNLTKELLMLDYKKHYLCSNTATYRRDALVSINGFDESFRRHQDLEFNIRFFQKYSMEIVKDVLVKLCPVPTSIDNKLYDDNMIRLKDKFLRKFKYLIDRYEIEIVQQIYSRHWDEVVRYVKNPEIAKTYIGNLVDNGSLQVFIGLNRLEK